MEPYARHKGPITTADLACPHCESEGSVDVLEVSDCDVLDGGITGHMTWICKNCGGEGSLYFFSEFSDFHVYDLGRTKNYYIMERVE